MAEDRTVPVKEMRAIAAYVKKLCDVLRLNDWTVNVMDTYTDRDHSRASILPTPNVREAELYLGEYWDEIDTDEEAGTTLLHEVLHLTNAALCQTVHKAIIPALPREAQAPLWQVYDDADEQLIDHLARALYPLMPAFITK